METLPANSLRGFFIDRVDNPVKGARAACLIGWGTRDTGRDPTDAARQTGNPRDLGKGH